MPRGIPVSVRVGGRYGIAAPALSRRALARAAAGAWSNILSDRTGWFDLKG
jgi:hypothetical protein